jgi:hypothetical protein
MKKIQNIIKFWHKIEYYSVYELKDLIFENIKRIKANETSIFPWEETVTGGNRCFNVYFGVFDLESLIQEIEKSYGREIRYEKLDIQSCVCTFKIIMSDCDNPRILPGTLRVSGLPFGAKRAISKKIRPDTWVKDFGKFFDNVHDALFNIHQEITIDNFVHLKNEIDKALSFQLPYIDSWFFIDEITDDSSRKSKGDKETVNISSVGFENSMTDADEYQDIKKNLFKNKDILNSFYAPDLEMLIEETGNNNYGNAFKNFFKTSYKRVNIETDTEAIKKYIHPDYLPYGSWPSKHKLSIMQQLAVNIFKSSYTDKEKIFSINGPPGTGKTTLLRDIIASIIVDRAVLLMGLKKPDDAFRKKTMLFIGASDTPFNLYTLDEPFRKYGMVVASSNNKAVENITRELPGIDAVPGEFINDEKDYFRAEANHIYGEGSWALISAALGNMKNCGRFSNGFWNFETDTDMDSMYEALYKKGYESDWEESAKNFSIKFAEVNLEIERLKTDKEYAPDDSYFKGLDKNEKAQKDCPWINSKLNKLRQELFIEALMLHRSFVLNSKGMKNNLNLFNKMLIRSLNKDITENYAGDLLQSFFMLVPVISTTFASVGRFLKHIKREEIGYLMIDEAGQAVPQAAAGAIWRSKKVIAVGDPLQIEPVVNIPQKIINRFGEIYDIDRRYTRRERSIQNQTDNANKYGAERSDQKIWVGCPLRVHRRCNDPMFTISNSIAYDSKMIYAVNETEDKKELTAKWADIKGSTNTPHYIEKQGKYIYDMLYDMFINAENESYPDVFIITPFTTVRAKLLDLFLENGRFYKDIKFKRPDIKKRELVYYFLKNTGTVHTFQGKEADTVILCLGGDINNKGRGAANWAASKPNILNVAVTRARKNLIIVGDKNLWSDLPHFKTAAKYLD